MYYTHDPKGQVVRVSDEGTPTVLRCPLSSRPSDGHCTVDCAWFAVDNVSSGDAMYCRGTPEWMELGEWRSPPATEGGD